VAGAYRTPTRHAGDPAPARELTLFERRLYREAFELALVALAFLLYFIVRANVVDRPDVAIANARDLIDLERQLSIFVEPDWQRWSLESEALARAFNFVYFWLDFPLIIVLGIVMYFRRRTHYTFARDAILFSGALALVAYFLYPLAPPRLTPEIGVIDTLQVYNNASYQAQSTSFFVNPYAAMPSLHVGWAFLLASAVVLAFPGNRLVLVLAIAHPIAQWASTIFTGNHYILDGVGGLLVAAAGLLFAIAMQRWGYANLGRLLGIDQANGNSQG
jgi:membrane-associated phospholipid phosphatase